MLLGDTHQGAQLVNDTIQQVKKLYKLKRILFRSNQDLQFTIYIATGFCN
ncbi:hypothetical protein bthur0001_56370 [Bacillus thuringiensis serovar tochigiensis BGSC 4Y1]|nr:hypothetical protein bthur0001_56370 [Bacillus thuringiensis serovar tochigiensis BGSC 4Y1]